MNFYASTIPNSYNEKGYIKNGVAFFINVFRNYIWDK